MIKFKVGDYVRVIRELNLDINTGSGKDGYVIVEMGKNNYPILTYVESKVSYTPKFNFYDLSYSGKE